MQIAVQILWALCSTPAHAVPPPDRGPVGSESFTVLLGTNTAFDGDPATVRVTLQGDADLAGGREARLALAVPVTWMTSGTDHFGVSFRSSVIEIPPSLRLRLLPRSPVRPYADLGLGVAIAANSADSWLFSDRTQEVGWMTRSAIGLELGDPRGLFFAIEPVSMNTYHLGDDWTRVGAMVGLGSRF